MTFITVSDPKEVYAFGGPLDGQPFPFGNMPVVFDRESGLLVTDDEKNSVRRPESGYYVVQKLGWRVSVGVVVIAYAWMMPNDMSAQTYILGGGNLVLALCRMLGGPRYA